MDIVILALVGYCIGSIPFGYLAGKLHGVDLRMVGSGSTGGTNVYRALGIRWATVSGLLDLTKGLLFLVLLDRVLIVPSHLQWALLPTPILGHIYPVWLRFKGGKGVSVAFGGLAYMLGFPFVLVSILLWVLMLKTIKIMSLVNLVLFALLPIFVYRVTQAWWSAIMGFVIALIIWWAHRENIARLCNRTEKKLPI